MFKHYAPLLWNFIPGYPGYQINEFGTIRSLKKMKQYQNIPGKKHLQYLTVKTNNSGYLQTKLSIQGKAVTCSIHRLLALTFIPNLLDKPEINHRDGNKLNNSLDNLEWATHSENIVHAYKSGLITFKTKPVYDRCRKKVFSSAREAAVHYGIEVGTLRNYLNGNIKKNPTCLSYHRTR